jgi:hypothetical protein
MITLKEFVKFKQEHESELDDLSAVKLLDSYLKLLSKLQDQDIPATETVYKKKLDALKKLKITQNSDFFKYTKGLSLQDAKDLIEDYIVDLSYMIDLIHGEYDEEDIDTDYYEEKYNKTDKLLSKIVDVKAK